MGAVLDQDEPLLLLKMPIPPSLAPQRVMLLWGLLFWAH